MTLIKKSPAMRDFFLTSDFETVIVQRKTSLKEAR
jgi:hypothetical protein